MNLLSKQWYYLRSIWTLLTGVNQPLRTAAIFLGYSHLLPAVIVLRKPGWRFNVRSSLDIWIVKETCLDQDYLWSLPALGQDWTVVDIGAGLGDFTVFAAKNCSRGLVHAYEPLSESYELLVENVALNQVSNVLLHNAAVASSPDRFEIVSNRDAAVSTRFHRTGLEEGGVPAVGLAELLDSLNGRPCDLMKIDCEGCEYDLLLNSPLALLSRIRRISMEYHLFQAGPLLADLRQHLVGAGFQVQVSDNPVHPNLGFLYAQRPPSAF